MVIIMRMKMLITITGFTAATHSQTITSRCGKTLYHKHGIVTYMDNSTSYRREICHKKLMISSHQRQCDRVGATSQMTGVPYAQ